jgi:hypothetical protein
MAILRHVDDIVHEHFHPEEYMRQFDTGATRDSEDGKLDYEGFISPLVLKRYAEYMHKNRVQADGNLRSSDNWQKGIPRDAYMKSAWRHFVDWWKYHRNQNAGDQKFGEEVICALLFNAMGYLHEVLLGRDVEKDDALQYAPAHGAMVVPVIPQKMMRLVARHPIKQGQTVTVDDVRYKSRSVTEDYNRGYEDGYKDAQLERQV